MDPTSHARTVGGRAVAATNAPRRPGVASFDVFDTCLTRLVGSPQDVHLLTGRAARQAGMIAQSPAAWRHVRMQAERNAAANAGGVETDLVAIGRELVIATGLPASVVDALLALELDVERTLLWPVPALAAEVDRARRAGTPVAFVSDMYVPGSFLRDALTAAGLARGDDVVMVSCETGAPKWTGAAFHALAERQQVSVDSISHVGDHHRSDVVVPRRLGATARLFDDTALNRFEVTLDRYAVETEGLSAAFAGASRAARLGTQAEDEEHGALRDVAAGVVAPAMVAFTLWVLRRAEQLGLRRLYYVARDGQILIDVARRLIERMALDVEVVYLYGSRLSWWLPSVDSTTGDAIEWAFATHNWLDVATIVKRLQLPGEGVDRLLAAAGLAGIDRTVHLTDEQLRAIRAVLTEPSWSAEVLCAADASRRAMLAYLGANGVLDGVPAALVDIGWIGRMHVCLGKVLQSVGVEPPRGLYFGISGAAPNGEDTAREAYFFDVRVPSGYTADVDDVVNMFDVFCTGFGGQTLGYDVSADDVVEPRFAPDYDDVKRSWGLEVLHRTVGRFTDLVVLDSNLVDLDADMRAAVDDVVRLFIEEPTRSEGRTWGAFPREDESGRHEDPLARAYRPRDVLARLSGSVGGRDHRYWKGGSRVITPRPLQLVIELGLVARSIRPRIGHRLSRIARR